MPWSPAIACQCGGRRKPGQPCERCGKGKRAKDTRKHAAARGYDWTWQKFRKRYLAENPLCVDCLPIVTAATDVHHKQKLCDYPELKYEEANLMALCSACHDRRTAKGE